MKKLKTPETKKSWSPEGHLLRSWEPVGEAEGGWLRGVGEGAGVVFTEPAAGGAPLEDGFRM